MLAMHENIKHLPVQQVANVAICIYIGLLFVSICVQVSCMVAFVYHSIPMIDEKSYLISQIK